MPRRDTEEAEELLERQKIGFWRWRPAVAIGIIFGFAAMLVVLVSPAEWTEVWKLSIQSRILVAVAIVITLTLAGHVALWIVRVVREGIVRFYVAPRLASALIRSVASYDRLRNEEEAHTTSERERTSELAMFLQILAAARLTHPPAPHLIALPEEPERNEESNDS